MYILELALHVSLSYYYCEHHLSFYLPTSIFLLPQQYLNSLLSNRIFSAHFISHSFQFRLKNSRDSEDSGGLPLQEECNKSCASQITFRLFLFIIQFFISKKNLLLHFDVFVSVIIICLSCLIVDMRLLSAHMRRTENYIPDQLCYSTQSFKLIKENEVK